MKGNQILAALLINSYLPFSFLSLPLLFVLCVRLTKMGSKLSFFFFSCSMCDEAPRVLGIQNASCQYFSCYLSFCSLLIRLIKRNNSLSFCVYSVFLGGLWVSFSFRNTFTFHSWTCKCRAQFRDTRDMEWTVCFYLSVCSSSYPSMKSPEQFGSSMPFVNETPQTQYHKCIIITQAVSNKISWSSLIYSPNQLLNDLLLTIFVTLQNKIRHSL